MKQKVDCILLVDDDEAVNFINKVWLQKEDVARSIITVKNGQMAMDYLLQRGDYERNGDPLPKPNIILLDINMPIMDGWEFLEEFKMLDKDDSLEQCRIYLLTSSPNPDDEVRAKRFEEVTGFFRKPISRDIIREMLSSSN